MDVIYPVITFAVAMVFFFLLIKRLFDWKVGLLSTLFLVIVPAFLHRTMAGFSDHEALGVMLMFMAMYFYVIGWQSNTKWKSIGWGALAGIFTGLMGLSWGGWKFFGQHLFPNEIPPKEAAVLKGLLMTPAVPSRTQVIRFLTSKAGQQAFQKNGSEKEFLQELKRKVDDDTKNLLEAKLGSEFHGSDAAEVVTNDPDRPSVSEAALHNRFLTEDVIGLSRINRGII